jgi:cobalt/nickel transport system permease protein
MSGGHGHEVDPAAPLDGPIERLAPEAKVVGAVAFLLVVVATPVGATAAWLADAVMIAGLALVALLPARLVARRLLFEVPFIALAAALVVFGTGPRVEVLGLSLSQPGLDAAWTILARATTGVLVASILAATTTPAELLDALGRLRAPRLLCTLAAVAVRYLAVLRAELDRLRLAQQLRSPDGRRLRVGEVAGIGAALFVRAYERGERIHLAQAARGATTAGLVGPAAPRPTARPSRPPARPRDWALALAPAALASAAALAAVLVGS